MTTLPFHPDTPAAPAPAQAAVPAPAPEPGGEQVGPLRHELGAVQGLIYRDLLRLTGQRTHVALLLLNPVLYLFFLGGGLAALIPTASLGVGYQTYLFPGMLVMTVQTPAIMVGIRLILDRQSGYLRELLMAPVRRATLLLGSCAGGTVVATVQGAVLLGLAGTVGLPYDPLLMLLLLSTMILISFTITSLALALAVSLAKAETFNTLLGVVMTPLLFLSGGFFPLQSLPSWAHTLAAVNPMAYGVDLLRRCIALRVPDRAAIGGIDWAGRQPPFLLEAALLLLCGVAALLWAGHRFNRPE
ncbi:ABC transporter permease [Streptomyces sp. NBC_01387]|uniref:ABC transporter permease n=1 Tax=unclassified Streptomyces TaxID=2593676 RepID=UPI0020247E52|nr:MULTISPECIES: ABC transporter permease [unclassified Streptomyces]MCX4553162.1 ABC transporter permease [Streptomyces sp. NBC_01500]WSC24444.1 ABC transporter permease [Streptomyces sp. NBC_01766]